MPRGSGGVVERARLSVEEAADAVLAVVDAWRESCDRHTVASAVSERLMARADRRVLEATGGLGLARWESACSRRRILTSADAKLRARSVRARPAVEAAVADRDRLRVELGSKDGLALADLAATSNDLLNAGLLAQRLAGTTAEQLRHLIRPVC